MNYAQLLARKKYLSLLLEDLLHEQKALNHYLHYINTHPPRAQQLLSHSSPYYQLVSSQFQPLSDELSSWAKEEFSTNPLYPENLIHTTYSGHMVRSKSEAIIDIALFQHQLPFRYECELSLAGKLFYPDFTIRHPKRGKAFYWEHFGKMDDPNYFEKDYNKLHVYTCL